MAQRIPWPLLLAILLLAGLAGLSASAKPSQAAGFPVTVTTRTITGQEGKILLIFAEPQAGGTKVACTQIYSAVFDTPDLRLKEIPSGGDPCAGGTPDAFIVPGMTEIMANVYLGGSQTPKKQVTATVDIQDESTWKLDGVALTADTAGDSDCDRETDSVDALHVLRNVAGMGLPAVCLAAGNLKCDDGITAVDSLFILRHVAQLPLNLPAGCPSPLAAPTPVSPEDGAVLQQSCCWQVHLDWDPVPGAASYTAQVDCMSCCAAGQYCAEVGRGYRLDANVQDTERIVQLGGNNKERWRIWAVNEDGTPSDFSDFRTFEIEVVPAGR